MGKPEFEVPPPVGLELRIPPEVVGFIREIANRHHTTDDDVIRRIFTNALMIIEGIDSHGDKYILREEDGHEEEIKIFD